jgi:putative ABC transport system permease protein
MRLLGAVAVLLRRIRAERGVAMFLFTLVAVTSFVVAASPRLFDRVADAGMRYEVARATSAQRNLQLTTVDQISAEDDDALANVDKRGGGLMARLPESVGQLIEARSYVVDTTRFRLIDPPNYTSYVTLRHQDGVDEHIEYVAGRPPARAAAPAEPDLPPRFEVALSSATAAELLVELGDILPAAADSGDPMLRNVFPRPETPIEIEVVGLFTVDDRRAPYWFDETTLAEAAIGGTDDAPIAFATALFTPEAYADVSTLGLPTRYRWRFQVDADRLDAGALGELRGDLRRLESSFGTAGSGANGRILYRSGLLDVLERFAARRTATEAALWVAALGPLAVAAGALGLVAVIIVGRRRAALALARGRGASAGQLLAAQFWEGLLISIPAALVGLLLAQAAVPSRPAAASSIGSMLVALTVTALLLGATWPLARRARRDLERAQAPARRLAPRRLVIETTVVGIAVAAAWLLRERGLGGQRPGGASAGFDPFLAAAPVLVGVATALVAIRLYPIPVRGLAWLTARRRDLVPALGLRTIGRNPSAAYLPLLVLTLTVAMGVFASVLAATIDDGQVAASWQEVGADYRIEALPDGSLGPGVDPATVPGVEAVAAALTETTNPVRGEVGRPGSVSLIAVDPGAHEAVLAGSPVAVQFPAAIHDAQGQTGSGFDDRPIPVLLSKRLPNGWQPLSIGEVFRLGVREQPLTLSVVGFLDDFPGVPRGTPFVVAPLDPVVEVLGAPQQRPSVLFVRGPADIGADLRAAASDSSVGVVASRHEQLAAERSAPLVAAVGQGFVVALGAAAVYAVLAVVAVVALETKRRARELAYLRTLGLSEGQGIGLAFVEHAPPALLALAIGILLGLGLAWLLEPGLGLAAFIDPGTPVRLQVEWTAVAAMGLSMLAVVGVLVVLNAWLARRLDPGQALRIGE